MSSMSQDDSIERIDHYSDKNISRKSSNYRDNYLSGSNSKHNDPKFQNSALSNSYETNDPPPYLNGSQVHDESGEYSQEHSKFLKDNYRNLSELEAVPERSIEHSDINKMSYMESEAHRWAYDQDGEDIRGSKSFSNMPKGVKESKYEQDSREYTAPAQQQINEKGGVNNFISPRFQMQSSGKKRSNSRSRSRERNDKENNTREDNSKRISQRNFNNLYNDTFNRRNMEQKAQNGDKDDSIHSNPPNMRHSIPSEPSYSQNMKNYLGRFSHKASPNNVQNLSAFEFHVNERTSDRSEQRRLNKTEFVTPYSRDDSFQVQDSSDITRIVQAERERNEKLEEKIHSKEKLLKRMKEFHDQLYQEHILTKNELERIYEERDNLAQEINHNNSQRIKFAERLKDLEGRIRMLSDENDRLVKNDAQKGEIIKDLEDRLTSSNTNIELITKKYEAKIESLNSKMNRLGRENKEILQQRDQMAEKLDEVLRYKGANSDDEKQSLKRNLDENSMEIRSLIKRNEELMHEVESLRRQNHERSRISHKDDSLIENNRRVLEERVNQSNHSRVEGGPQVQELIAKYKHKIAKLEANNENLKLELQSRPSMRKFKENEVKIHSLENELEGVKNHPHEHRKSTEINFTGKILRDIIGELEIENIGDILPKIREMQENSKANSKFVSCVLDLVARCSPGDHFDGKPTPKQAWKWIKRLMEEYMNIKKEGKDLNESAAEQETLRVIMDYLMVDEQSEISSKLRNVLVENNLMKRVINKVKSIHNLDWVNSLQDLERKLESNPNSRTNGPRYHHQVSN